jgi:hypothetical protein
VSRRLVADVFPYIGYDAVAAVAAKVEGLGPIGTA